LSNHSIFESDHDGSTSWSLLRWKNYVTYRTLYNRQEALERERETLFQQKPLKYCLKIFDHYILPEYVYYEKNIPWNTFSPTSPLNEKESRKILVEEFFDIGFDKARNSLVGKYYYMHDSVQEREYDAINREWGAIVSAWKS